MARYGIRGASADRHVGHRGAAPGQSPPGRADLDPVSAAAHADMAQLLAAALAGLLSDHRDGIARARARTGAPARATERSSRHEHSNRRWGYVGADERGR